MKLFMASILAALLAAACSHVVSREMRTLAGNDITARQVFQNPDAYLGKLVILGGMIASTRNAREGTYMEIVEKELDYRGMPKATDRSQGRFIVLHDGYLDRAIFSTGRYVTVAGVVMGRQVRPLGEMDYSYLMLKSRETHLVDRSEGIPVTFGIGIFHSF